MYLHQFVFTCAICLHVLLFMIFRWCFKIVECFRYFFFFTTVIFVHESRNFQALHFLSLPESNSNLHFSINVFILIYIRLFSNDDFSWIAKCWRSPQKQQLCQIFLKILSFYMKNENAIRCSSI